MLLEGTRMKNQNRLWKSCAKFEITIIITFQRYGDNITASNHIHFCMLINSSMMNRK